MTDTAIAFILFAAGIILVSLFLAYKRFGSRRRMMRMLIREGVDPDVLNRGDKQTVLREIRRRCLRCQAEDVCERWLKDPADSTNQFCPNARVFRELKLV